MMGQAIIYFDGGGADNIEDAMGGGVRELISLATLLSDYSTVTMFLETGCAWQHGNVNIEPLKDLTPEIYACSDLFVGNNLLFDMDVPCMRKCFYQWIDYAGVPDGVDLVITDTWRGKIKYIQQGYDAVVLFPYLSVYESLQSRDGTKLLFVGALHNGKRPDLAIEAMKRLSGYELHVIGHTGNTMDFGQRGIEVDAEYFQRCRESAGGNVIFRGELPYSDMIKEMQTATAIIIPYCSANEFNTNVALEAVANGCVPIIASGLVDYLSDTDCVRLPNQSRLTPQDIADALMDRVHELAGIRISAMSVAKGIAAYCKREMLDAILGKSG